MARLLYGNHQYQEVDLGSFHEPEIQDAIKARAGLIYPGYYFAPFEVPVTSSDDTRKPDFILVEREYRSWWVGEVEMIDHSLYTHVIPQVRIFRDGYYDKQHVDYVVKRNQAVDPIRFAVLIETERPSILVVANRHHDLWLNALHAEGVKFGVFEMFRRVGLSDFIFRINGYVPEPPGEVLTNLEVDAGIARLLSVLTPSAVPGHHGDVLQILVNGASSDWKIMLHEDKAWLNPVGGHRLAADQKYVLRKTSAGMLAIEPRKG